MKKILLALLIGGASLTALSSCTKEYITNYLPSQTMVYTRVLNDWQGTDNRAYLDLTVAELSDYYVKQGVVTLAISMDNEKTYMTIPATYEGIAYSYDYQAGSVRIYAQDPIVENVFVEVPAKVVIKVSLTDADYVQ